MIRRNSAAPDAGDVGQFPRGLRVLLADGEEESRKRLEALLRSLGMTPTVIAQAWTVTEELCRAADAGKPYALLLYDATLRGSAALRARRAGDEPRLAATPRIELASGPHGEIDASERRLRLRRPVTREALVAAVRLALDRAAAPDWPSLPPRARAPATERRAPVVDRRALVQLLGGDEATAERILQRFVELAGAYLRELDEAAGAGGLRAIREQAHRLKGSLAWISAERAAGIAAEIEELCQAGKAGDVAALCRVLRSETEAVVAAIASSGEPGPG